MRLTDYISMFPTPGGIPATRPTAGQQQAAQRTSDLGLMMAATAAADMQTPAMAIRTLVLGSLIGGRVPGYLNVPSTPPISSGLYNLYAHLWALLGVSTTDLGLPGAQVTDLQALVAPGAVVYNRQTEWGDFVFGDGTVYGQDLDTAYVLRETALAGLALHNEAIRTGSEALLDTAWRVMLNIVAVFRSAADPRTFATVVSRRQASTAPDAEAYALTGLLALRFGMHEVVDALIAELERCAVAQVTDRGLATGYAHVNAPVVSIRSTALVAAFQYAAMEAGMGRGTVRGLQPYRLLAGPHARLLMDLEGPDVAATLALDVAALPSFLARRVTPGSTITVPDFSAQLPLSLTR